MSAKVTFMQDIYGQGLKLALYRSVPTSTYLGWVNSLKISPSPELKLQNSAMSAIQIYPCSNLKLVLMYISFTSIVYSRKVYMSVFNIILCTFCRFIIVLYNGVYLLYICQYIYIFSGLKLLK